MSEQNYPIHHEVLFWRRRRAGLVSFTVEHLTTDRDREGRVGLLDVKPYARQRAFTLDQTLAED